MMEAIDTHCHIHFRRFCEKLRIFDLLAKMQSSVASRARRYPLCILANMLKHTWQAMHVWTHIVFFTNFSLAAFCKNLLGNIPNPSTIFSKSATLLRS